MRHSHKDQGFEKGGSEFNDQSVPASFQNFVGVGPKGYKRPDGSIHEEVCTILTENPDLDASRIEVSVASGEVILRGEVDSRKAKHLAEDLIVNLSGIHDIRNELHVKPYEFENMFTGMEDVEPGEKGLIQNNSGMI